MAEIILRPRFYEIGPFQEQYAHLVRDLEAKAVSVELEREVEDRSAGGAILGTAYDLAVHVADEGGDVLVDLVVIALVKWLRGRAIIGRNRGRARKAAIYDQTGRVIREVELPEDEGLAPGRREE